MVRALLLAPLVWALPLAASDNDPVEVDPGLPLYEKTAGVSGSLSIVGSDTLNNLMSLWAEGFRRRYPNVVVGVEGKGSGSAPPALMEGAAQLGPMSRPMKLEEIERFEARMGYRPTAIGIALDALVVYVHKDNPLEVLTLPQVDAIFSRTRRGGWHENIIAWRQLGVEGRLGRMPISIYGRNSASGTYGFFKEHALFRGDFKNKVKEQPGSSSVVMAVTRDPAGIGYSGMGYQTSSVKGVSISRNAFEPAFPPNAESVLQGEYPLSRLLYIYVALKPGARLPLAVEEFLLYALSREGQAMVARSGYIPLPAPLAEKQVRLLDYSAE